MKWLKIVLFSRTLPPPPHPQRFPTAITFHRVKKSPLINWFTSSPPYHKDQFTVSDFSTSCYWLIQVYNWQIRYHSLVCRCGLADSLYITIQQVRAVKLHVSTYFTSVSFISWRSLVMDKSSSATCLLHSDVVKGDPSQVPCTWLRKRTKKKPWKG